MIVGNKLASGICINKIKFVKSSTPATGMKIASITNFEKTL